MGPRNTNIGQYVDITFQIALKALLRGIWSRFLQRKNLFPQWPGKQTKAKGGGYWTTINQNGVECRNWVKASERCCRRFAMALKKLRFIAKHRRHLPEASTQFLHPMPLLPHAPSESVKMWINIS